MATDNTLLVLLLILALGLIIPELLRKFRLPFITLIILAGAILGPFGLGYVQSNETINFFGFLGMAFLMFMAGLETDVSKISKSKNKILIMALFNGFIPFIVGVTITKAFGYQWVTSILIGVVFISSSVAIIVPSLKNISSIKKETTNLILAAVLLADIVSLVALGIIFQNTSPITSLPLPIYFLILIISIPAILYLTPKISNYVLRGRFSQDEGHERRIRFVVIMIISILAYLTLLGVHEILAAFLAGISLAKTVKKDKTGILYTKLHTLGYGLFVPIFFFIVGMEMNVSLLREFDIANILMFLLIFGLIFSKMVSGYFAGRIIRLSKKDSMLFGSISITQLTTTLAVTYAASSLGLLDSVLVTSIILLSVITTFLGPILVSFITKK
jgi:Kef-type K+ transport system membrane component KefB